MERKVTKSKPKSREYPAATLSKAIRFIEILKDYVPHKPISYKIAAEAHGVNTTTKSFRYTLSAAKQYGLVSTASGKTITFLDPAKRLINSMESPESIHMLKLNCFKNPSLNSELISQLSGQSIPSLSALEKILVEQYKIVSSVSKVAASTFLDTAEEVGAIQNGILDLNIETLHDSDDEEYGDDNNQESDRQLTDITPPSEPINQELSPPKGEFAAPLNIPFGDKRRAVLHMPIDASKDDAEYVKDMIVLMFRRVYGVQEDTSGGE